MNLNGRVAVVTGASQGIGRACALVLAEAGADVALASRNVEKLEAVAKEIEAKGYADKRSQETESKSRYRESVKHYISELWGIWNTVHEPADALEAFEEVNDDLGMEKNQAITREVKQDSVWKRLNYCLTHKEADTVWRRRMEAWDIETRRRQGARSRYNYY